MEGTESLSSEVVLEGNGFPESGVVGKQSVEANMDAVAGPRRQLMKTFIATEGRARVRKLPKDRYVCGGRRIVVAGRNIEGNCVGSLMRRQYERG